jgi:hypothetical protein
VNIDGTNAQGSGANMNAVTTIGDPDNPADEYAFKITNQGTQSVMFKMNYYFSNTGWIQGSGQGQSHINFEVFANANESAARDYPDQRGYNKDYSLANAEGSGFGSNTGGYRFNVGEEYYVVITIDTTGPNAAETDDLSGTAVIEADTETSSDSWDPANHRTDRPRRRRASVAELPSTPFRGPLLLRADCRTRPEPLPS